MATTECDHTNKIEQSTHAYTDYRVIVSWCEECQDSVISHVML